MIRPEHKRQPARGRRGSPRPAGVLAGAVAHSPEVTQRRLDLAGLASIGLAVCSDRGSLGWNGGTVGTDFTRRSPTRSARARWSPVPPLRPRRDRPDPAAFPASPKSVAVGVAAIACGLLLVPGRADGPGSARTACVRAYSIPTSSRTMGAASARPSTGPRRRSSSAWARRSSRSCSSCQLCCYWSLRLGHHPGGQAGLRSRRAWHGRLRDRDQETDRHGPRTSSTRHRPTPTVFRPAGTVTDARISRCSSEATAGTEKVAKLNEAVRVTDQAGHDDWDLEESDKGNDTRLQAKRVRTDAPEAEGRGTRWRRLVKDTVKPFVPFSRPSNAAA